MSTAKHTPGPWKVDERAGRLGRPAIFTDESIPIFIADIEERIIPNGKQIAKANAHLVAAAPELLHACKDILDFLKSHGYDTRLVKAAISKAEGRP